MTLEQEPDPLRRIPVKHPAALRAEIGPILRAARLKRGQSLEAVAQQTRISKRFLEALENDRFEQFPAVVYLRGFLKGYCEHLDVNFEEVWALMSPAPAAAAPEATADPGTASAPAAQPHVPSPRPAAHAAAHRETGAAPAIILSVLLALALAIWLYKNQAGGSTASVPEAPVALLPLPRQVEPKLSLRLKDDAWLRVAVDGQVVFEGRAPRDAVQEWKPLKFVDIRTAEPGSLEFSLNGQPAALGAPSADGQYRIDIP
jgi:transcriptional regulator with XRE-family HTH domain